MISGIRFTVQVLILTIVFLVSTLSFAEVEELTAQQEQQAATLYGELKCPVCKNQSLAESTSFLAEEMKVQIRDLVAAGKTNQDVIDFYVERYGDWILMRPRAEGRGLVAWLAPGGAILFGLGWVFVALRRWSRTPQEAATLSPEHAELVKAAISEGDPS